MKPDACKDWHSFEEGSPFSDLYRPAQLMPVPVLELHPAFQLRFPRLSTLLKSARSYRVELGHTDPIKGQPSPRFLFAWSQPDGSVCGWLCFPPGDSGRKLHPDHITLSQSFGGIDEHWGGPSSLLNNVDSSLAACHASVGFANRLSFDMYVEDEAPKLALDPDEYVTFSTEAAGSFFAYHRETGEVIFVGCDNGNYDLQPISEYSDLLFRVERAAVFARFVEKLAGQWLRHVVVQSTNRGDHE